MSFYWLTGRMNLLLFLASYFVGSPSLETMFRTYTIQFNTSICRFLVIQMAEIIHTFCFPKIKSIIQSMSCPARNQRLRFCRTYIFPNRRKWCMSCYASFQRFSYCRTYMHDRRKTTTSKCRLPGDLLDFPFCYSETAKR